jgi:hypothetical protein
MDPDGSLILPRLINLVLAIYLLLCLSYFFFIRVLVLCSFPSPLCVSFLLPSLLLLLPLQPILLILLESPLAPTNPRRLHLAGLGCIVLVLMCLLLARAPKLPLSASLPVSIARLIVPPMLEP